MRRINYWLKLVDGDKINNIILVLLCCIIGTQITAVSDLIIVGDTLSDTIGHALMTLFISVIVAIRIILPYTQALIVLILKRVLKAYNEK